MKIIVMSLVLLGSSMQAHEKNNNITSEQAPAPEMLKHPIKVKYTNWRGETAIRSIVPLEIYFGATEYHPEEQWLMRVWDVERAAERIYAFKDIKEIIG